MKTCDYRQEENVIELILKAKDIRVEFKGRTCLDIDELVSLLFLNGTQVFGDVKDVITQEALKEIYGLDATLAEIDGRLTTVFYNQDKTHKLIF